jgi:hypothetical protein
MKFKNLCLMATGATIAVAAMLIASAIVNPTRARAQAAAAAPAPGGVSMVVSAGNTSVSGGGNAGQGGIIAMQDSVSRKVTVVSYYMNIWSASSGTVTPPIIALSTNASFSY